MAISIRFAMPGCWEFFMPMSYTLGLDQRIFDHVGSNFYGYDGSKYYRTIVQLLGGINIPWIELDFSQWPTRKCLGLLTPQMSSEPATSFPRSQMANSTLTGLRFLTVRVMQTTGNTIISTGELSQIHANRH